MKKSYIVGKGQMARAWTNICAHNNSSLIELDSKKFEDWHKLINKKSTLENNDIPILYLAVPDRIVFEYSSFLLDSKNSNLNLSHRPVHFSGSLFLHNIEGLHPTMSFGSELKDGIEKIPFVCDSKKLIRDLSILFRNNKFHYIKPNEKELYHTFCTQVCSGISILLEDLWTKLGDQVQLDKSIYQKLVATSLENWFEHGSEALSGPLIRGDEGTLHKHRAILSELGLGLFQELVASSYENIQKLEPHKKEGVLK